MKNYDFWRLGVGYTPMPPKLEVPNGVIHWKWLDPYVNSVDMSNYDHPYNGGDVVDIYYYINADINFINGDKGMAFMHSMFIMKGFHGNYTVSVYDESKGVVSEDLDPQHRGIVVSLEGYDKTNFENGYGFYQGDLEVTIPLRPEYHFGNGAMYHYYIKVKEKATGLVSDFIKVSITTVISQF